MPTKRIKSNGEQISLAAAGDIFLNRNDPIQVFRKIKPYFESFDIVFANLEAPLSLKGSPRQGISGSPFHSETEMIEGLVFAGFNIVSVANNHIMDYGPAALMDTLDHLDSRDICHVGAGRNQAKAREALTLLFLEQDVKVSFIAFDATPYKLTGRATESSPGVNKIRVSPLYEYPHINNFHLRHMRELIKSTAAKSTIVITSFHWGESPDEAVTVYQRALAREAIDAGATLVLGHHPHVPQGIEMYNGKVILYSLGNFVMDLEIDALKDVEDTTVVFEAQISHGCISKPALRPVVKNERGMLEIVPLDSARGEQIVHKVGVLTEEFGTKLIESKGRLYIGCGC